MQQKKFSLKHLCLLSSILFYSTNANAIAVEKWIKAYEENPISINEIVDANTIIERGTINNGSIGATRRVQLEKTYGATSTSISLTIDEEVHKLIQSHISEAKGYSKTIWDGTTLHNGTKVNQTGLGKDGINFLKDIQNQSDAKFYLIIPNTDMLLNDCTLNFDVYHIDGRVFRHSFTTKDAQNEEYKKDFKLEIPFTSFNLLDNNGIETETKASILDFKNIGAVSLTIKSDEGQLNIEINAIYTNGTCQDFAPKNNNYDLGYESVEAKTKGLDKICCDTVDVCGICNGDGTSCIDCAGTVNGTKKKDKCGVCLEPTDPNWDKACTDCAGEVNGNHVTDPCGVCETDPNYGKKTCYDPDCKGTKGGSAWIDVCGVCMGDGTSCRDCKGIINGKNRYDDCGECLDVASPYWNQGLNTFECAYVNNSDSLSDTDRWLTQQKRNLTNMLNDRNYCSNKKKKKKINSKAVSILSSAKAMISSFPTVAALCQENEKTTCKVTSLMAECLALAEATETLYKETTKALKIRRYCLDHSTGTCEMAEGCEERLRKRYLNIRRDRKNARELRNNALLNINNLTDKEYSCVCGKNVNTEETVVASNK